MAETYSRTEKLAGLFLFLALIGGVALILFIGQGKGWFQKQQTYLVRFPQSYNLQQGASVRMFNTDIGTVTRLRIRRIGDEHQVEITLKVNAQYSDLIRLDSVAQVESPTILGSEFLSITPGTFGYPPIEPYGTIPSRVKKTLADYLEEFQPEESLHKARLFIANMASLSEQLKAHEQKLLSTLNNFDTVLVSILEAKGTLGKLLMQKDFYARLEGAVARVETILKNSEGITQNVQAASEKMPPLLDQVGQELEQVRCLLLDLRRASGQLPELLETTEDAARTGKEVLDAVKANPLIKMTLPTPLPREPIHLEPRDVP
ncbi:MAG: MCE family protein [Deltaproteobacteria bacterium]|nr:MCE family protein [Deltaproteobacteria bacterium]